MIAMFLDSLRDDIKFSLRQFRRSPGFFIAAVLTLAVGLGTTTFVLSVIDALMLRPYAFAGQDRVAVIRQFSPRRCATCYGMTIDNFLNLRQQSQSLSHLSAADYWRVSLRTQEKYEVLRGFRVTSDLLSTLGVHPALGRLFVAGDDQPAAESVVILSEALWASHFGRDREIIGRQIVLGGEPYLVIGVLDAESAFPPESDLWAIRHFAASERALQAAPTLLIFGTLKFGRTLAQGNAELAAFGASLREANGDKGDDWRFDAHDLREWRGQSMPLMLMIIAAAIFVLLIACANFGGLMLARGSQRRTELMVRSAIGARKSRMIRQLLTESLVLSTLGFVAGCILASASMAALHGFLAERFTRGIPGWTHLALNGRVVAAAAVLVLIAGILSGLAPALQLVKASLADGLRSGSAVGARGRSGSRIRAGLVIGQVALALVMIDVSGLLVRSAMKLNAQATVGIDLTHSLTMRLQIPSTIAGSDNGELIERLITNLEALPDVVAAATANYIPLTDGLSAANFSVAGEESKRDWPTARTPVVTADYFKAMGIAISQGRTFSSNDGRGTTPVVVVSQSLVDAIPGRESPIGRIVRMEGENYQIIGVVSSIITNGIGGGNAPDIYRVNQQLPQRDIDLVIRTRGEPLRLAQRVGQVINGISPDIAVERVRTMDAVASNFVAERRIISRLLGSVGILAVLIAALGLYGAVSNSVAQRTREFGLRLALGSPPYRVLALVVGDCAKLTATGTIVGALLAIVLARSMGTLLYGIGSDDPATIVVVMSAMALLAVGASAAPAMRAIRVAPNVALREE